MSTGIVGTLGVYTQAALLSLRRFFEVENKVEPKVSHYRAVIDEPMLAAD